MGYYCTVPQCTSLAGKTKNVKFHRFPRDTSMADKWNIILKRGKPYTKYSKVCSLHFTQADYNVTTMGKHKGILVFPCSFFYSMTHSLLFVFNINFLHFHKVKAITSNLDTLSSHHTGLRLRMWQDLI